MITLIAIFFNLVFTAFICYAIVRWLKKKTREKQEQQEMKHWDEMATRECLDTKKVR